MNFLDAKAYPIEQTCLVCGKGSILLRVCYPWESAKASVLYSFTCANCEISFDVTVDFAAAQEMSKSDDLVIWVLQEYSAAVRRHRGEDLGVDDGSGLVNRVSEESW